MRPVVFALIAVVVYATQNVILEQKLAKYSVPVILVYLYLVMMPIACVWLVKMKLAHQTIIAPSGAMIWLMLGLGVMYFVADSCYIGAYNAGGNVMTVTTILIMMPVVASAVKFAWNHSLPNGYQVAGYLTAVVAVLLMTKGGKG